MHLLLAQQGSLADADEAVDLGQTPGDIVFISAADTEIAALSAAKAASPHGPSLRCASLTTLSHNMSVDVYARDIVAKAKLVIVRCLGGAAYWRYGLEACQAACERSGGSQRLCTSMVRTLGAVASRFAEATTDPHDAFDADAFTARIESRLPAAAEWIVPGP